MAATPPPDPDRALNAGGILLTTLGAITVIIFFPAVIGTLVTGDVGDNPGIFYGGIAIALFGGAQLWTGIQAIARKPAAVPRGQIVSWVGFAVAAGIAVEAIVGDNPLDLILAGFVLAGSIAVLILLRRAGSP